MEKTTEDSAMRRAHLTVAAAGALLGLGGVAFFGFHAGASVLVGATVASVNLLVLARTVQKMVQGAGASWAGVAFLKFLVLMAVTYVLIESGLVLPLGLAVGFGALPLGILVAGTFPGPASGSPADDFRVDIDIDHRATFEHAATFEHNVKSDHA
jgi:hypothetical protein